MPDFLPRRDAELVTWLTGFCSVLSAAPADFGLSSPQAAAAQAGRAAFVAAFDTASNATTRSPVNVRLKNLARAAVVDLVRSLARIVRATPGITADQLEHLGLAIPAQSLSSIPAPASAPRLRWLPTALPVLALGLSDALATNNRGKPAGVAGAALFYHYGDYPPASPLAWTFLATTSRTRFNFAPPQGAATKKPLWIAAFWFNGKSQRGPASRAIALKPWYGFCPSITSRAA